MTAPQPRRSVPSEESTRHFDPVLQPVLAPLYQQRAARLRQLAVDHELAAYLQLAAQIADQQAQLVSTMPSGVEDSKRSGEVVSTRTIVENGAWRAYLQNLVAALLPEVDATVDSALQQVQSYTPEQCTHFALALLEGDFTAVPAATAPFIWAALSTAVALHARESALPVLLHEENCCPVCGGLPVASLIHTGSRQGLRYLHCSVCESEWHMVRAKCTNCGDTQHVDYLSIDSTDAVVRAESCRQCDGYLKVISRERDPDAETVADDLATLVLDMATTEEGYGRTGLNPFALPG